MPNKVRFGLKNVHYAALTFGQDGAATFGTPVAIPGAVSLSMSRASEAEDFYADDGVYYSSDDNSEFDGDLEMALIPEAFRIGHLGEEQDSNGVLATRGVSEHAPFALLFEFTGDAKAIRHVIYNCTASQNELAGETKGENLSVQTETLNLHSRLLPAENLAKARTGDTTPAATYDAWYNAVYLPVANTGNGG